MFSGELKLYKCEEFKVKYCIEWRYKRNVKSNSNIITVTVDFN